MDSPKFCSHCGSRLHPGSVFCARCGTKVVIPEEEVIEKEVVAEKPVEEVKPEPIEEQLVETPIEEPAPVVEEVVQEEPIEESPVVEEPAPEVEESPVVEEPPVVEETPANEERVEEPLKIEEPVQEEVEPVEEPISSKENLEAVKEEPAPVLEQPKKELDDVSALAKTVLLATGGYVFGHTGLPQPTKEEDEGDELLEPRKRFVESLKEEHKQNTIDYFDELVKESGIDIEENRRLKVEERKLTVEQSVLKKKMNSASGAKVFSALGGIFLVFGLAGLIIFVVFLITDVIEVFGIKPEYIPFIFIGCGIATLLGILFFVIMTIKRKRANKAFGPKIKEIQDRLDKIESEGYAQMAPLNNLFDFNIMNKLLRKTTPLIRVDDHPDMQKVESLINKFGWQVDMGRYNSTLYMKTGSIKGNPFLLYKSRKERTVNETYTGSLTITWTKKVTIGKTTTYIPVTQVLTAFITKPRPDYSTEVQFVFGSEAAPNLIFSRSPMIHDYSEKGLKKLYTEREKVVDKYAKEHPDFTPLGNDEFEDFFDGVNRNNEVEYRLLFTPLAQRSMLDLIKNKEPFGDNFSLRKNKMLNSISVYGTSNIEHEGDPRLFQGSFYDDMRENFINLNAAYFKNMYAQLAPLLAIPLYQQYPTDEYIFKRNQEMPFSRNLCEMLSNRFYQKYFEPDGCATPIILKCDNTNIVDNSVQTDIYAYGYTKIAHTEYISKLGGDGHFHNVPVTWYEYIPIQKVTPFVVHETYLNKFEYDTINKLEEYHKLYNQDVRGDSFSFFKGYFTFIKGNTVQYTPSPLNEIIKKNLK